MIIYISKAGDKEFGANLQKNTYAMGVFSRISDEDVKAIYRYLQTVEPVNKNLEKVVYAPGEEF